MTGSGFITLAATLSAVPAIPVAGLALLLGVDRFMSEARAITNLIGNAVATIVVARWEGAIDMAHARLVLNEGVASDDDLVFSEDVIDAEVGEQEGLLVPASVAGAEDA